LGLSVGNGIAITGALLYILMHGLAKGGLFLCAGIVEQNAKTKNITKLGGLINTMPVTAASFFLCALSIMGVPPLGGFFSKYMVFSGTLAQGNWVITAIFLAGAFLTIIYLFRVFNLVFMGEAKSGAKEGSPLMLLSVGLLALLSLIAGVFIAYPYNLAQAATLGMLGAVK
jgi:NADH-quinone oxidoreductase subunit L